MKKSTYFRAIIFLILGTIFYALLLASAIQTMKDSLNVRYTFLDSVSQTLNDPTVQTGRISIYKIIFFTQTTFSYEAFIRHSSTDQSNLFANISAYQPYHACEIVWSTDSRSLNIWLLYFAIELLRNWNLLWFPPMAPEYFPLSEHLHTIPVHMDNVVFE